MDKVIYDINILYTLERNRGDLVKYSIGICDGDSLFCSKSEKYIMDLLKDNKERADIFVWNTGQACLNDLKNINLDILFLDVDLPDENGIEVCEHIRNIYRYYDMHIVFVSDKKNLSLEVFRANPYTYLEKNNSVYENISQTIFKLLLKNSYLKRYFFTYKFRQHIYKVPMDSILYFESNKKYLTIYLENESERTFIGRLNEELEHLSDNFIRIGQSYIVNINKVKEYHSNFVYMNDGKRINISRPYRISFRIRWDEAER